MPFPSPLPISHLRLIFHLQRAENPLCLLLNLRAPSLRSYAEQQLICCKRHFTPCFLTARQPLVAVQGRNQPPSPVAQRTHASPGHLLLSPQIRTKPLTPRKPYATYPQRLAAPYLQLHLQRTASSYAPDLLHFFGRPRRKPPAHQQPASSPLAKKSRANPLSTLSPAPPNPCFPSLCQQPPLRCPPETPLFPLVHAASAAWCSRPQNPLQAKPFLPTACCPPSPRPATRHPLPPNSKVTTPAAPPLVQGCA